MIHGDETYRALLAERFPTAAQIEAEYRRPVPAACPVYAPVQGSYRGPVMRWEQLLWRVRAERGRTLRGVAIASVECDTVQP